MLRGFLRLGNNPLPRAFLRMLRGFLGTRVTLGVGKGGEFHCGVKELQISARVALIEQKSSTTLRLRGLLDRPRNARTHFRSLRAI